MNPNETSIDRILRVLQERAKELDCLYHIDEILKHTEAPLEDLLGGVLQAIPMGYQYPTICVVRIAYLQKVIHSPDFIETPWVQSADILIDGQPAGKIEVFYTEERSKADSGPFLNEEKRLITAIAQRIADFIAHQRLQTAFQNLETARHAISPTAPGQWRVIIDFLKRTDQAMLKRITRKMLNHLCWLGIDEALGLLEKVVAMPTDERGITGDENQPMEPVYAVDIAQITDATLTIAASRLSEDQMLTCIQKWIREDRARFFVTTVGNPDSTLGEVTEAVRRLKHIPRDEVEFPLSARTGLRVSLIEHFFTDQHKFIEIAKRFIDIDCYDEIVERIVFPPRSQGKLGGKSAGLFLATRILELSDNPILKDVKTPRSWYITTDCLLDFIQYNDLEDVFNQKYAEIDQVRAEYPHIVQMFRSSKFSPHIVNGLSRILDDLEGKPLVIRSSSLLEDRFGAAFSGKYKSLFLDNQGTKAERLAALMDAISEVYASVFAPDPIEYRAERGLLDVYEEMGILVQEVVGTTVDKYFLPAFSGVAFSRNEFRWSPRIKREDGLVRLVPGLGTRAVDRLKDDYPVLLAPGQPNLRVNVSFDEAIRYSPKKIDVIDLGEGAFRTVELRDFLQVVGSTFPQVGNMVSIVEDDRVRKPIGRELDYDPGRLIFTFEGLVSGTPFIRQIKAILETLEKEIGSPVDIEFASDGRDLYLLQCRPQSFAQATPGTPIPPGLDPERILFSANRFVSNGHVPNITHIVYVDPEKYNGLPRLDDLRAVGRAVGRLNKLLPKRQFILMGPGRWGSRGDIKLGVNVTYADINNTAVLIEIARKKGNYLPDLSFGTHFFQDLVEASIRYLPLYPDDAGIHFNEPFLLGSESILTQVLPESEELAEVIRVIDVPKATGGMVLRVAMNADQEEALAYFSVPEEIAQDVGVETDLERHREDNHWRWRLRFAESLAANLDGDRFGVQAIYLFGSTKNATAGPASDIDLMIHFRGTEAQRADLKLWLEGWSWCLSELNFLRTGYRTRGLLDVHIITDEDIEMKSSYAVKIGAVTDPARPLAMKGREGAA